MMNHPKAYALILGIVSLFICSTELRAQNATDQKFYRYFVVSAQDVSELQMKQFAKSASEKSFYTPPQICLSENKILVAVDINYPKRVDEIKEEIAALFTANTAVSKLIQVEKTDIESSKNFCK